MKMEFTNVKQGGELRTGLRGKDGKLIVYTYGMTLDDKLVDEDKLKNCAETGLISAYIKKGWVVKGKINTANKIIGTPVTFEKIEVKGGSLNEPGVAVGAQEEVKPKVYSTPVTNPETKVVEGDITPIETPKAEAIKADDKPKKRGRPAKLKTADEVIAEVKTEPVSEVKTETPTVKPKEDDFI